MNPRITFAVAGRVLTQIRRDHRTLALMFVAPIVIMALLGWVIRDQGPTETRVAIINNGGVPGEVIRARIGEALNTATLTYREDITTEDTARQALIDDQIDVALLVALNGQAPQIRVLTLGRIMRMPGGGMKPGVRSAGVSPKMSMPSVGLGLPGASP